MNFLAIDPGVHACAVAVFRWDGDLRRSVFSGAQMWGLDQLPPPLGGFSDAVVVERPVIRGNNTPNPQTIVDLAWAGARFAYSFGVPVHEVTPQQWKGQVPKPIHHARVLQAMPPKLSVEELVVLERCVPRWASFVEKARSSMARGRTGGHGYGSWTGHNLLDAVALGVWARENLTALRG